MERIRKLFRNPTSDLLLLVGFVISCVILLNIADFTSKTVAEENTKKSFTYTSSIMIGGEVKNSDVNFVTKYIMDCLDKAETGNVYILGSVYIDGYKDIKCASHILMSKNEDLQLLFKAGNDEEDTDYENAVIIGESLEESIIEENGKSYININNDRFNVIGILENNTLAEVDTSLYILWDTMTTELKEKWMSVAFYDIFSSIYYESNENEPLFLEDLKMHLSEYGIYFQEIEEEVKSEGDKFNEMYKIIKIALLVGALIFSVITCFSVSYLWLLNRRRELSIRISYGYSDWQIFKVLFKDTLWIMMMALAVSVIIQLIYGIVLDSNILFDNMFSVRLLVVFGGILCIALINTWYIMKKMRRFSVVMINEDN